MSANSNWVQIKGVVARTPATFGEYKRLSMSVGGIQQIDGRDVIFFQEVRAGGDEGKFAAMMTAGTPVLVTGTLRHDTWTNDKGEKQSKTYVKAASIRALPSPEVYEVEQRATPAGETYFLLKDGYVSVTISGNLSRAELKYVGAQNTPLLSGSFASKEEWLKDGQTQEYTNWINFSVWGDEAERLANLEVGKGWNLSLMDGTIRNSSSKKDGKTYQNTNIEVGRGRMEFLPKRGAGSSSSTLDIDALMSAPPVESYEDSAPF